MSDICARLGGSHASNRGLRRPQSKYHLCCTSQKWRPQRRGARTTGVITLNGVRVVGPLELNPLIPVFERPVRLLANDTLGVELRGVTASGIALDIVGVDIKPPVISGTINPPPNAAGWNNSNVTVAFTCSDQTSGVASCPPPVTLASEGAHHVVSGTVTNKAGQNAMTSVVVNLDKRPLAISGTLNPLPDARGWNSPREFESKRHQSDHSCCYHYVAGLDFRAVSLSVSLVASK